MTRMGGGEHLDVVVLGDLEVPLAGQLGGQRVVGFLRRPTCLGLSVFGGSLSLTHYKSDTGWRPTAGGGVNDIEGGGWRRRGEGRDNAGV